MIYFIIAMIYGLYAVVRHWQINPHKCWFLRILLVFMLNGLFFPISFILALKQKTFIPTREENDRFLMLLRIKR